jgi:hypothetical protein
VEMTVKDIPKSAMLLKEAYEKDAILCNEKPNLSDIFDSLLRFLRDDNCFMYIYKEEGQIKGVCGFIATPSIVDVTYLQAIEIACNPLVSLHNVTKGKIFLRMIDKMEEKMKDLGIGSFIMTIPKHFNSNKYLKSKGYMNKEYSYVKEIV